MSISTKERIIALLGVGAKHSTIAASCGVTPAYISQLLDDPAVLEEVARLSAGRLERAIEADETLDTLEQKVLQKIKTQIDSPLTKIKPAELARIFSILNTARRKAVGTDVSDAVTAASVTFVLPKNAAISMTVNSSNQVTEVNGKSLATLPSAALVQLTKPKHQEVIDVPSTSSKQPAPTAKNLQQPAYTEKASRDDSRSALTVFDKMTNVMNPARVVI